MNLPHERREAASPHEWLRHARSDLLLARLALKEEILPEQICFHAQQAAEKAHGAAFESDCVSDLLQTASIAYVRNQLVAGIATR